MQQLTGLDNLFLCIDAGPVTNAVIGDLVIYEPSTDPGAGCRERVVQRIAERLPSVPPLRRVAQGLPVGINNYYLRDVEVDVEAHVREIDLAPGGSQAALESAVAGVMQEPLDPDRPLWEFVILRGLHGARLAHLFRAHHGIIDGPTLPIVVDLLSDVPSMRLNVKTDPAPPTPAVVPEFVELLARGLVNTAMAPARLLSIQGRTLQYLLGRTKYEGMLALPAYVARMLPGGMSRPLSALVNGHQKMIGGTPVRPLIPAMTIQKTPFNGKLTQRRSYIFTQLPLADFARAADHFGTKIDDVVVAVCAGALRRYMQRYGDVPERPLILCVPASIRTGKEHEPWATHLSMLFAEFPTNVDDPVERLRLVHDDLTAARGTFDALPMHMLRDASRLVPLTMLNLSMKLLSRSPEWVPGTPWNVVVATVALRPDPLQMCGLTMSAQYPVGFLTPGMGLNISVYTYNDQIGIGFCGCPDLMPDVDVLAAYVGDALGEMLAGLAGVPARSKSATPRQPVVPRRPVPATDATGQTATTRQTATDAATGGGATRASKPTPRRARLRPASAAAATDAAVTPTGSAAASPAPDSESRVVSTASADAGGAPDPRSSRATTPPDLRPVDSGVTEDVESSSQPVSDAGSAFPPAMRKSASVTAAPKSTRTARAGGAPSRLTTPKTQPWTARPAATGDTRPAARDIVADDTGEVTGEAMSRTAPATSGPSRKRAGASKKVTASAAGRATKGAAPQQTAKPAATTATKKTTKTGRPAAATKAAASKAAAAKTAASTAAAGKKGTTARPTPRGASAASTRPRIKELADRKPVESDPVANGPVGQDAAGEVPGGASRS